MTARARQTDPFTSHEAAKRVERNGNAKRHRDICRQAVLENHGQTSGEIAAATGLDRHTVSRRLPEIDGIRQGERRVCKSLGTRQVTWWPINVVQSNCRPHNNPDNYVIREGVAYCKFCQAYVGRVGS